MIASKRIGAPLALRDAPRVAVAIMMALSITACAPAFSPARMSRASADQRILAPVTRFEPSPDPAPPLAQPLPPALAMPAPAATAPALPLDSPPPGMNIPAPPLVIIPVPSAPVLSLSPAPAIPDAAPLPPPQSMLSPGANRIALVLPLESPVFGAAAEAVMAGFSAAAEAAHVEITVIPHGDGGAMPAIEKARAMRAAVIVGPLLRDDVKALGSARGDLPTMIALNQLDEGATLPPHVYTLALSVDAEARQIARRMRDEGARTAGVVVGDSALNHRFAASFTGEWILQGGGPPAMFRFDRAPDALSTLRRELTRASVDAIVLAVDSFDAAGAAPFLGRVPVYASSQVNDRLPPEMRNDLDNVRFVETPWLAEPDSPALAGIPRREWSTATQDRLYALGIDAFRVAQAFVNGPPQSFDLDGATGHLTLEPNHQIGREGKLVRFQGGALIATDRP